MLGEVSLPGIVQVLIFKTQPVENIEIDLQVETVGELEAVGRTLLGVVVHDDESGGDVGVPQSAIVFAPFRVKDVH